jgi:hypothetical protein
VHVTDLVEQQATESPIDVEQGRSLYGSSDGDWIVVVTPLGSIPPPTIVVGKSFRGTSTLMYLGDPADAVRQVYHHLRATEESPQARLADLIGVKQPSVSRYVTGEREPDLSSAGWSCLVRQLFQCRWGI